MLHNFIPYHYITARGDAICCVCVRRWFRHHQHQLTPHASSAWSAVMLLVFSASSDVYGHVLSEPPLRRFGCSMESKWCLFLSMFNSINKANLWQRERGGERDRTRGRDESECWGWRSKFRLMPVVFIVHPTHTSLWSLLRKREWGRRRELQRGRRQTWWEIKWREGDWRTRRKETTEIEYVKCERERWRRGVGGRIKTKTEIERGSVWNA